MRSFLSVALLIPGSVWAHSGSMNSLIHGFYHPITGWDHFLAMGLIGIIASRFPSRIGMKIIGSFLIGVILLSFLSINSGLSADLAEQGLAVSLVMLGLVTALLPLIHLRSTWVLIMSLVAGSFHGMPHGLEIGHHGLPGLTGLALVTLLTIGLIAKVSRMVEGNAKSIAVTFGIAGTVVGILSLAIR